jgi:hypothetical protein
MTMQELHVIALIVTAAANVVLVCSMCLMLYVTRLGK